jgi:sensor histidine kinase YesM
MQLHPHFLFNSLHGISTLMDMDRSTAKAMVVKLSNLLRRALQYGGTDLIALDEELRFAREYLDLERMRLGARLAVDWVIDPGTEQILVPHLILQPLLENAVRHGVSHLRDGGWIEISASKRESSLELCVRNSIGQGRARGFGVGLRNTEARLRLLYSDDASLTFTEGGGHMATATILLPALGSALALPSKVHTQAA